MTRKKINAAQRDAMTKKHNEIDGLLGNLKALLDTVNNKTDDEFIKRRIIEILGADIKAIANAKEILKRFPYQLTKYAQQLENNKLVQSSKHLSELCKKTKLSIRDDLIAVEMTKANSKIAGGSVAIILGLATMAAASTGAYYLAIEGASQFAQHFAALCPQISTAMTNMSWIAPAAIALVALIGVAVYALGVQKAHSGNMRKQELKKNPESVFAKEEKQPKKRSNTEDSFEY